MESEIDDLHKELFASEKEVRHLKSTIDAMRDALDLTRIQSEERVAEAVALAGGEIRQLRATIDALHDQMELNRHSFREESERVRLRHERECRNLQESITLLRHKLDEKGAK